jgi:hypothetical protein
MFELMADCSELAENIVNIGMALATREDVKTFDDMVLEMQKIFPALTRQGIVESFLEVQESRKRETNDLQKKLQSIYNEPKIEKTTKAKIDELNKFLEEGEIPEKKTRKPASMKIEQLRTTRDNLRKWLETGDPSMKKKLNEELTDLTEKIESGDIEMVHREGQLHDEVQKIKDEINQLKARIAEQEKVQELQDKIEILQAHLEAGTLPQAVAKTPNGTETTQALRSIIYDLRKQLNRSEPARKKRIEKSIADLEQKLLSGDILPKPKPPQAESKELDKLIYKRETIKKEIQDEIRNLKPMTFWGRVGAGWDLARLIMTTGEFSFALRQGGIYAITHPLKWSKALANAFKSFASPRALYDINKEIFERENAPLYQKSGLVLLHEGMSLTQSEEVIMNYWQDKLPVLRNFNRAALGFFNTLRADLFDLGYQTLGRTEQMTQGEMEVWANYINVMSGRGKLSVGNISLEPAALILNRTFFSARYVASRFQLLTGQPLWTQVGEGSFRIRKQIAKEYARLGLGLAAIFSLGMAVGADVEDDPRSVDFGKLRFGKRRLDVLMGTAQVAELMARLFTGTTKTSSGDIVALRPVGVFFYDDKVFNVKAETRYGGQDVENVLSRFLRSKLSPQMGIAINLMTGKTYTGEEITMLNTLSQLAYPITYGDIYDVMKEENVPLNVALTGLTLLGMGLQTYEPKNTTMLSRGF